VAMQYTSRPRTAGEYSLLANGIVVVPARDLTLNKDFAGFPIIFTDCVFRSGERDGRY